MFAGSGTGGIPGSGSDRSATGLATGQVSGVLEAERTGAACPALDWDFRIDGGTVECEVGRKMITLIAITATTATDTPPNHTVRRAHWPAGQPTLPMPILPARPSRRRLFRPGACGVRDQRRRRLQLPYLAGAYTQAN